MAVLNDQGWVITFIHNDDVARVMRNDVKTVAQRRREGSHNYDVAELFNDVVGSHEFVKGCL